MNLETSPNYFNPKTRECKAIIETPKGWRNKFKYVAEYELFALSGLLAEGLSFPFDFGFIPSTKAQDGDPLDVMVLMDEPAHVGCLLDIRIIGVIEAEQTEGAKRFENDRLLAVAVHSYSHANVASINEVSQSLLNQIDEFFISYNKSRGKTFAVKARRGPKRAVKLFEKASKAFHRKK